MTRELLAKDLILPLPRPEYVALPEGFLSAMAEKLYSPKNLPPAPEGKKLGLRFFVEGGLTASSTSTVHFVQTVPTGKQLEELAVQLESFGMEEMGNEGLLASALVNSVKGSYAAKSRFIPASPLTPSLALMQNLVGLSGKKGPPDLVKIIETIYSLGKMGKPITSASSLYRDANAIRLSHDKILTAIDHSLESVVWGGLETAEVSPVNISSGIVSLLSNSPFSWFALSWDKITSKEWILALPARVWVDWATSVLRTGFAMAYLWETSWYQSLARELLGKEVAGEDFGQKVVSVMEAPIVWRGPEAPAEIRDVASKLKWRCYRSVAIRNLIEAYLTESGSHELPISEFVKKVRNDPILIKSLQEALSPNKESTSDSADRLWEAISYTLKQREKGDHYGFLDRTAGRYSFASPGIEWGAFMASMSAAGPGRETNLGDVSESVRNAGISAQGNQLLDLLERTGLTRGSADADLALKVETAYKQGDRFDSVP
jgi:hypothetical protein